MSGKKKLKPAEIKKKIYQLYENYGVDCGDMEEDELERLIKEYSESGDIEADLELSKQILNMFSSGSEE